MVLEKMTDKQLYVLRSIQSVRVTKRTRKLQHKWVEQKTLDLQAEDGVETPHIIKRQNWSKPFAATPNGKIWELIGEAVLGKLPHNDPVEKKIREFSGGDSVTVKELKEQIVDLESQAEKAVSQKDAAEAEHEEFKGKYYTEQCTDAHYRLNFEKTVQTNKRLVKAAKIDEDAIRGLTLEVANLQGQVSTLESKLSDEDQSTPEGTVPFKKPNLIEPHLSGNDPSLTDEDLRLMYLGAIDESLEKLEKLADKKDAPDVTIVLHDFNVDVKDLLKINGIPTRSQKLDNIIFAYHGVTRQKRTEVFRAIAVKTPSTPRVVVVSGKGKVEQLPVKERTEQDNHEWFANQVRSGVWSRGQAFKPVEEGYETVIYRRLGDE